MRWISPDDGRPTSATRDMFFFRSTPIILCLEHTYLYIYIGLLLAPTHTHPRKAQRSRQFATHKPPVNVWKVGRRCKNCVCLKRSVLVRQTLYPFIKRCIGASAIQSERRQGGVMWTEMWACEWIRILLWYVFLGNGNGAKHGYNIMAIYRLWGLHWWQTTTLSHFIYIYTVYPIVFKTEVNQGSLMAPQSITLLLYVFVSYVLYITKDMRQMEKGYCV